MKSFKIKSHAKINLALNVTGKKIKLHKIESIVSFIDLHDLIYLKQIKKKDHKIFFECLPLKITLCFFLLVCFK